MVSPIESVAHVFIKVGGSDLSTTYMDKLHLVEVDGSLHMPAMATLEFYDEELALVDDTTFDIGKPLEISMKPNSPDPVAPIFKGMILSVEPVYEVEQTYCKFVVRAYDRLYGLHRGRSSKVYLQVTDSDAAKQVISAAGLSAAVDSTTVQSEHLIRDDMSDYDFIKMLARRNGYVVWADGTTINFKNPESLGTDTVELAYGEECREFRPNLSVFGQVDSVTVQGWDPANKQQVTGQASSPTFAPTAIGVGRRGKALAVAALGSKTLHVHELFETQAKAESQAKAVLNSINAADVTAEGVAWGNPKLKPGCKVTMKNVGTRFGGSYLVTRVRHRLDPVNAYTTDFWVGGMASGTVASILSDEPRNPTAPKRTVPGLVRAIVTNVEDPDGQGRVKLTYPWLSETAESHWAPVVSVGAGNLTGIQFLPEVNDEVLVGFAHGDLNYPFVLGGLWNGRDATPVSQSTANSNGVRIWQTRNGNFLKFTDKNSEAIELQDKAGKNLLKIDIANKTITIESAKDIILNAEQGDIKMKAMNIKMESTQGWEGSATTAKLAAKGQMELTSSGMAKISGTTVMIN